MRAFVSMLRTALRQQLQYRSAALAGIFTQVVFGLIYVMVYRAFYAYNPDSLQDMTLMQTISYAWISQGTYRMMSWSGVKEIEAMMRDGRIAFELARPMDLHGMWFARAVALRTAPLLLNFPCILVFSMLLLPPGMRLTLDPSCLPLGFLSLFLGMLVSAAMTTILTSTYFWTISGQGINRILPMVGALCAGNMPLAFFPAGVRFVLRMLPFASIVDAPLRILVGAADAGQALAVIGLQVLWLLLLTALGKGIMGAGVRKCMVQGG